MADTVDSSYCGLQMTPIYCTSPIICQLLWQGWVWRTDEVLCCCCVW